MDLIGKLLLAIPGLPLAAAILIALIVPKLPKRLHATSAIITIVAMLGSFIASWMLISELRTETAQMQAGSGVSFERVYTLWTWADVQGAYHQDLAPPGTEGAAVDGGVRDFTIGISLRADTLTAMMLGMVTFISTLVAVFSIGYMHHDRGYWRFFSYVSLFVFSMTMLVSVSNFLLLFVFWEAVGVCSYLLIGFWYEKKEASAAGKKAFLVNRVGDFGFALAIFLIWITFGTLNYHDTLVDSDTGDVRYASAEVQEDGGVQVEAPAEGERLVAGALGKSRQASDYPTGGIMLAICLLLLIGACGKSAQFPLHVWLPDAMEGPTPVSALIHAATMVTAGVYMVTRCTSFFMASPTAQLVVACIGGFTALLAALIALTQFDLKRVLAYSTISQLGYMFLALGVGTFAGITSGMFHLFTHAFFKALLFLGAGSVMHSMGHVIDMRRFGGLKKVMPVTYITFLIGCLALAGIFPLAGFWSKDSVVAAVHDKAHHLEHAGDHHAASAAGPAVHPVALADAPGDDGHGSPGADAAHHGPLVEVPAEHAATFAAVYYLLYWMAMLTALLTAFYTFRAFFLTFHGPVHTPAEAGDHPHESPVVMWAPLATLGLCAVLAGVVFDQTYFADPGSRTHTFAEWLRLSPALSGEAVASTFTPYVFHVDVAGFSLLVALAGIGFAAYLYLGDEDEVRWVANRMQFDWFADAARVTSLARIRQSGPVRSLHESLSKVHLDWLATLIGYLLFAVLLIILLPLLLINYIFQLGRYISPYNLSYNRFYIDELYQFLIVKPLRLLASLLYGIDRFIIDGLVNTIGRTPPVLGNWLRSLQMGLVQFYALVIVMSVVLLIFVQLFWTS